MSAQSERTLAYYSTLVKRRLEMRGRPMLIVEWTRERMSASRDRSTTMTLPSNAIQQTDDYDIDVSSVRAVAIGDGQSVDGVVSSTRAVALQLSCVR